MTTSNLALAALLFALVFLGTPYLDITLTPTVGGAIAALAVVIAGMVQRGGAGTTGARRR